MADKFEIKLTPDAILKKHFATIKKGYDLTEVDNYLDQIIADYEVFYDAINSLEQKNKQLSKQVYDLKNSGATPTEKVYEPTRPAIEENGAASTNFEIIQRLSSLERKVYQLEQNLGSIHA